MARVFLSHPGVAARVSGKFGGSQSRASSSDRGKKKGSRTFNRPRQRGLGQRPWSNPRWNTFRAHRPPPTTSFSSGKYGKSREFVQRTQLHASLQALPDALPRGHPDDTAISQRIDHPGQGVTERVDAPLAPEAVYKRPDRSLGGQRTS